MKAIVKKLYALLPFKREIFSAIRLIHPPKSLFKHLHFKGDIKVNTGKSTFKLRHFGHQVENEIFWEGLYGGWEKESMKIWMKLIVGSEVVLDIGANSGLYALATASDEPNASIYAFEPVARVYDKLNQNVALNDFTQIKTYEIGLSDYTGEATIYDPGGEHVLSVTVNEDRSDGTLTTTKQTIAVSRLDDWLEAQEIRQIDLMKIDVEYHEPQVLEGMGAYLKKYHPTILIEILTDEVADKVATLIDGLDYDIYDIDEENGMRQIQAVQKSSNYNLLLLANRHAHLIS